MPANHQCGKRCQEIDHYISKFSSEKASALSELRNIIYSAAPEAEEAMGYGMPALKLGKYVVYFAGFKNHMGLFPTSSGIRAFQDQLQNWKFSKGTIQFPYEPKLPKKLIREIVQFRMNEVRPDFMNELPGPMQRALLSANIWKLTDLKKWKESDVLSLHGVGSTGMKKLKGIMEQQKTEFSKKI